MEHKRVILKRHRHDKKAKTRKRRKIDTSFYDLLQECLPDFSDSLVSELIAFCSSELLPCVNAKSKNLLTRAMCEKWLCLPHWTADGKKLEPCDLPCELMCASCFDTAMISRKRTYNLVKKMVEYDKLQDFHYLATKMWRSYGYTDFLRQILLVGDMVHLKGKRFKEHGFDEDKDLFPSRWR